MPEGTKPDDHAPKHGGPVPARLLDLLYAAMNLGNENSDQKPQKQLSRKQSSTAQQDWPQFSMADRFILTDCTNCAHDHANNNTPQMLSVGPTNDVKTL